MSIIVNFIPLAVTSTTAGEISLYGKSGYFSQTETIDGQRFVRESGFISGFGASYSMDFARYFTARGAVEGFYGDLDYEGVKLSDMTQMNTDTSYIGTKEEVALAACFPVGKLRLGPLLGFGHKWFDRSRSNELWSYFFVKGGAVAELRLDGVVVTAEAGVMNQLDTSINVDWSYLGYGKITSKPKGKINPFAEIKVKGKNWFAAFYFEQADWSKSNDIPIRKTTDTPNGVVIVDGTGFQPDTKSSTIGLEIGYEF